MTATVDGYAIAVGAPTRLLNGAVDPASVRAAALAEQLQDGGRTAVVVTADGRPIGVLGIADRLRPDAATTVMSLGALTGTAPMLFTGDNPRAATRLAAEAGITDVRATCCPRTRSRPSGPGSARAARSW